MARLSPRPYRAPAAISIPCRAMFNSRGLTIPPWGVPLQCGTAGRSRPRPPLTTRGSSPRAGRTRSWPGCVRGRCGQGNTRHKTHLDGFPATVRVVRARHAWEGRPLELIGWMRRHGRLELIVVLPDGSRLLLPAAWTDLKPSSEPPAAGTLGSLDDLLAARRVLEPLLERAVREQRDDRAETNGRAASTGSGGEPGARGGVVGAGRRGASPGGVDAAGSADRAECRARGGER